MRSQQQLIECFLHACECDVEAFKPGNVSVYNEGHDMTVNDFLLSAKVSSEPLTNPDYSLGEKIFYAVKATREAVGCNTNLGILLLCAPLMQAAFQQKINETLKQALKKVLGQTTVDDAEWVFKAITLADPGGLGESEDQDVNQKPVVTLTEAMEISQHKDKIAYQYTSNYIDVFDFAVLRYNIELVRFGDDAWATTSVFTGLLSKFPDSHVERKYGKKYSDWILEQMITVDDALLNTNNPEQLMPMLHKVDKQFKEKGINPGTTADLTVATVLVHLLEALSVRCTR